MKLIDYITTNHHGVNKQFADANGYCKQQVGVMVQKGYYYVYDGMLMISRKELKPL